MDLGITNIFIFYLRSWLILFIVISQPSFDHRLTLAIYLTDSVWVNQYKRNREFWSIYSPKFHDTLHVSKNLTKTSYYYIRSKSLITPYSTQRTPPGVSSETSFLSFIISIHSVQVFFFWTSDSGSFFHFFSSMHQRTNTLRLWPLSTASLPSPACCLLFFFSCSHLAYTSQIVLLRYSWRLT